MEYKIIGDTGKNDEDKMIEKTFTEERKEIFSISHLKREIEMNNRQIADLEKRNVELQAKINASVETLDLKI